jgi:cell division protein FtsL
VRALKTATMRWMVLSLMVSTLAALAHVWVRLQVIAVGYDLSRETKIRHDLAEMNQRLSLELRTRTDLALVEKAARETLHMAPVDPRTIRVVSLQAPVGAEKRRK